MVHLDVCLICLAISSAAGKLELDSHKTVGLIMRHHVPFVHPRHTEEPPHDGSVRRSALEKDGRSGRFVPSSAVQWTLSTPWTRRSGCIPHVAWTPALGLSPRKPVRVG